MKLLLIRHGETDWNTAKRIQGGTDIPLNENGRRQAQEVAAQLALRPLPFSSIYTSPLSRASETAAVIADRLGMTYQSAPGLEEIRFGLWEGICWEEVQARFPAEFQAWRKDRRYGRPPQGESYQDLLARFVPALQKIIRETPEGTGDVLVVSHSACIMSLLSLLNGTPFHEMVKRYELSNTAVVELDAARIADVKLM